MQVRRLLWLEATLWARSPPDVSRDRDLGLDLRKELRGFYEDEQDRWAAIRPPLCVNMYEIPRSGRDVLEKNESYSMTTQRRMAEDVVRTRAYTSAINRAVGRLPAGARVLDVGSGPFLLLGRMALHAGAHFVACIEHSKESNDLAAELVRREACAFDWRVRPYEKGGGGGGADRGSSFAKCTSSRRSNDRRDQRDRRDRRDQRDRPDDRRDREDRLRRRTDEVDSYHQMLRRLGLELQVRTADGHGLP